MRKLFIIILLLMLTGCARECEEAKRKLQSGDKPCIVKQYSGGELIGKWEFDGIINSDETSDGYYFTIGDTLYEVSGDIQVFIGEQ